jgi:general secretion pathway protein C
LNKFSAKSPLIPKAATMIAALLLGLSGARSINALLETNDKQQEATSKNTQLSSRSTNTRVDYGQLVSLHLLGKVENNAKQANKKSEIIKAPETNLSLKLIGVLFNRDKEDGYAIISESGKRQKTFHKGDKLPGNATLYAVESNRVILERNGRHETLSLLKPDINAKGQPGNNERATDSSKQAWKRSRKIEKRPLPKVPAGVFSKTKHTI